MAAFHLIIYGRFWVITEDVTDIIKVILGDTLKKFSWRLSRKRLLFCH